MYVIMFVRPYERFTTNCNFIVMFIEFILSLRDSKLYSVWENFSPSCLGGSVLYET